MPSFSKFSVFKMFPFTRKRKAGPFSNSSALKSVFEKLRHRVGLLWTVGLTVEIKLPFFNFLRRGVDGALFPRQRLKFNVYLYTNSAKSGNFYLRKTPKGSFIPLFPLNWTIAMVCFTACPLLKYRNLKDYKTRPPDLLREQKKIGRAHV